MKPSRTGILPLAHPLVRIAALVLLIMLIGPSCRGQSTEASTLGDTTGDGIIDGRDALRIMRSVEGYEQASDIVVHQGDVSPFPGTGGRYLGDGRLSHEDAEKILRYTVGLLPEIELNGNLSDSAPHIDDFEPLSGPVGTKVTITGANFIASLASENVLLLGDIPAPILEISGTRIITEVPDGASTGLFSIRTPGGSAVSPWEFVVTTEMEGDVVLDGGLNPTDFVITSPYMESTIADSGHFTVSLPQNRVALIAAVPKRTGNHLYMSLWVPNLTDGAVPSANRQSSTLRVDSLSTAKALVFLHPYFLTDNPAAVQMLCSIMDGLQEVQDLARVVTERYPLGVDGLNDPAVESAWGKAVAAVLNAMPAALVYTVGADGLRPVQSGTGKNPLRKLDSLFSTAPSGSALTNRSFASSAAVLANGGAGTAVQLVGVDRDFTSAGYVHDIYGSQGLLPTLDMNYSPVDWFVRLDRLDPQDLPCGINEPFRQLRMRSIKTIGNNLSTTIASNLWTSKIDILYTAVDMGINTIVDTFYPTGNALPLEANTPDCVYVLNAYSGVFWSPLEVHQEEIPVIPNTPGGWSSAYYATAINIVLATVDCWDLCTADSKAWWRAAMKKAIQNCSRKLSQDLATIRPDALSIGQVFEEIYRVSVEAAKAVASTAPQGGVHSEWVQDKLKSTCKVAFERANVLLGVLDKISSAGRFGERLLGLLGYMANPLGLEITTGPSPVETILIVTGDPFSPLVTAMDPVEAGQGAIVTLKGERFGPNPENNFVSFRGGTLSGDVEAEVTAVRNRSEMDFRVPAGLRSGEQYTLVIATTGSLHDVEAPEQFLFRRLPRITSVEPAEGFPAVKDSNHPLYGSYEGTTVTIKGFSFEATDPGLPDRVTFDGVESLILERTDTQIVTRVPDLSPSLHHSVYIVSPENDNAETTAFNFEIPGLPVIQEIIPPRPKLAERVTIRGQNFGHEREAVVLRFQGEGYFIRDIAVETVGGTSLTFRMPDFVPVGQPMALSVWNPSGQSESVNITRTPGIGEQRTVSLPQGWKMNVTSSDSGPKPDGKLSLDEAAAIGRGDLNPWEGKWDDKNETVRTHWHQRLDPVSGETQWYEGATDPPEQTASTIGKEYRREVEVSHYLDGSVQEYLVRTVDLDYSTADYEEGDWIEGQAGQGGKDFADRIVQGGDSAEFQAVNLILGNDDDLEMRSSTTLILGGNGLQVHNSSRVIADVITAPLGVALTILGDDNSIEDAHFVGCQYDAIVVQNGARNSFYELQIEGAAGNGIVIRGDGGNKIDHVAVDGCAQNGILIEGSQLNEIYDTTVSECGESGLAFTKGAADNRLITVYSTDNLKNGIFIADSPHNPITNSRFSGEQAGIALSGQASEGNQFTQCLIKSVEDPFYDGSPQHGIHIRGGANNTWIDECQIESTIAGHGILVEGEGTTDNLIEYCSFSPTSTMKCGQDGICFQGGASGNHLLWIDILYRGGNGITITGPNTEANLIENCYAGNNAGWGLRIENQSFANEVVQGRFKGNGLGGVSIVDVEPRVGDTRIPFFIHNTLIGCQTIVLTPEYYGFQMNDVDPDNAGTGILLQNAQSGFLDRNYILGHDCAFEMQNTAGNLIQRQNIFFSKGDGIVVENSREDRIESVYVMESTRNGIQMLSCTGTAIVGSAAYLNGGSGCVIQSCTAVLLEETALGWNRTNGLLGKNSVDTTIRLCSATRNEENGYVVAEDSVNTVFNRSDADSNRGAGYLLADCRNVTLLGRQLYDGLLIQNNNNYGILVSDAQDVFIGDAGKGVIVAGNGAAGIFVTGANTQNVAITSSLIVNKNVVNQPYYAPDEAFLEQPYGIHIHSGRKIRIGGPSPQEGNHIESPHDVGILIEGENSGVSIVNNNIGEPEGDETDTRSNGNVVGIELRNNACTVSIFDNRIRSNQQVGIRISGGASGNLIQRNHISDNGAHGVVVDGPSSLRNTITRNSIFLNGGKGIASLNGGNTGILPPTVNSMTWEGYNIVGTCDAPNGSVVEVYADHEDEGRILVGSSLVFNKCFYISGFVPPDENLHGIVIDPAGNTSEFGPSDLAGRTESAGSYVFASRTGQGQDVFLKLTNEEVPLQLTNHPAEDYDPQISQDGSEVLFVSNRSGNPDLWILNRNTSEVRQITENASPDYDPDWLAGTDRILFVSDRSGNPEIYLGRTEELQFSDPVRLTDNDAVDRYPVWSPDGSRIAFASSRGGAVDIWVMNSDGSGVVRMTDSVGNNLKPAWSPDGSKIAFVSDRDGNEEVYLLDVASKSITRLTNYSASDTDPTWTRSGGRVLFASNRESGYEMYSLGTGATIPRRLTNMLGDAIQPDAGPSYLSGESASVTLATDPLMPDEGNPGRTLAAAAVHLTLDSVQAKAGETCEIHATLTEAINVANLAFGVEYEPVYLRLLDLSPGVLTENALFAVNPEFYPSDRVPIRQNWIRASAFNGDSPVMTMTFGVDKQAESGVYPIGVLYPVAYDTNFSAIPVTVHPGTITVEGVDVLVEQWMLH